MELRQLRYFVTVAEELHFGRAAERLLIGQPAVSQQIRRLERELKVELFDRSPRLVRLTPAGEAFLPAARAVLGAEDAARAVAADLAAGHLGALRLGTITGLGDRLGRILDAFGRQAPEVRVELVALPVRERLAQLADGRLDAAFVRGPLPEETPGLRYLPLWQDELLAAVPARHPLAERTELSPGDLAELPLRMTERRNHPTLVDLVLRACHAEGFEPIPGPPLGSLQDTLAAIGTGTPMWTVVYASNADFARVPRIAFVPFAPPGLSVPVALAVRQGPGTPRLDLLLAACGSARRHLTSDDQDS
ncbi:LysR substrate-binding domain-containing protein [Kitasatospora kifunensis]|uniref:DNA-binding transcriptional LysR family regulator n=1 Tax=Kitasatospora kifunensis TaxID=58351 RepID=A0A7W7R4E2_KITKI|nr:LysR family transcriptional regulator [Kitasatospora kifunensis]MBB4924983.1 DNA-binding transcriptional LysR family regulator [Kitasatospora kifunensis]